MAAEIGDSVIADGRAGEVVGFEDNKVVVRPFGRDGDSGKPPECFVATRPPKVVKKYFERGVIPANRPLVDASDLVKAAALRAQPFLRQRGSRERDGR